VEARQDCVFVKIVPIGGNSGIISGVVVVLDSSFTSWVLNCNAVENFVMENHSFVCRKKTGPLELAFMNMAIIGNSQEHIQTSTAIENMKSQGSFH